MSTQTLIIIVMAVYLAGMIGIGLYGRKFAATFNDSITAAKQSTTIMIIGGAVGAHIGSGFVVGGAESGAIYGIAGAWYGIGCGISWLLVGVLVAKFFYRNRYLSLSDYFKTRYNDKSTRLIYSISTPLSYVAMFAGQILAGKAIFQAFGIDGNLSIIITALVVLFYASISGLWGAYMTSVIQVAVIVAGLIFALISMIIDGGFAAIQATLPATYFDPVPFSAETLVSLTIPTILAALFDQTAFQRTASAKSEKAAVRGHIYGGLLLIVMAIIPPLLGMYGIALFPNVDPASVFIDLIFYRFSPIFGAFLIAAIVSAIMSTCDGAFIGIATNIIHDIYQGMINPDASEKQLKVMQNILNVIVCIVSIGVALMFNNILSLLSMAYTILTSGCLVPFVGGLLWKRGTAKGALASAIAGIVCALLISFGFFTPPYSSVFPVLPAVIVYFAVSLLTQGKQA